MADSCCSAPKTDAKVTRRFRRALWFALVVNVSMLVVELSLGWRVGSVSLLADAVDFFGDSVSYGISLAIFSLAAVWRSRTALLKGLTMACYGVFILAQAAWFAAHNTVPEAGVMGAVAIVALVANLLVAFVLYSFRDGDADMRSVWLCSRNDAIGNLAVMGAALGVFGTGAGWPDLLVAVVMAALALTSARAVILHARQELKRAVPGSSRLHEGH